MRRTAELAAACAFAFCSCARADLTITTSTRSTATYFYFVGALPASSMPHNESTTAVGPWSSDISSSIYDGQLGVRALQQSDVGATGMWGRSTISLTTAHPPSLTTESSRGLSIVSIDFHVDTPTEVYFSCRLVDDGIESNAGNGQPGVSFEWIGRGFLAYLQYHGSGTDTSSQFQGVLQPGDYQIQSGAVYNHGDYRSPSFTPVTGTETAEFQLIVPAPSGWLLLTAAAIGSRRRR